MSRPLFAVAFAEDLVNRYDTSKVLFNFEEYKKFEDEVSWYCSTVLTGDYAFFRKLETYSGSYDVESEDEHLAVNEDDISIIAFFDNQELVTPDEVIDRNGIKLEVGMTVVNNSISDHSPLMSIIGIDGMKILLTSIPREDGAYFKWEHRSDGSYGQQRYPCKAGEPINDAVMHRHEFCRNLYAVKLRVLEDAQCGHICVVDKS